jgi:uncharacterized repeat protein (TIGR03803 family)
MKTQERFAVVLLFAFVQSGGASEQTLTTLYSFSGYPSDGDSPYAGLVQGNDGNFYGTTSSGGASGKGIVFRISPGGSLTNLHSFSGPPTDGDYPSAGLVQGSDGNFYGTTSSGGTNDDGTVFRISPGGTLTNLYSFGRSDGAYPNSRLVQGSDSNLYGTTVNGGVRDYGTVFRISPGGSLTNLYSFSNSDGAYPNAGLAQGSGGDFYGTTASGGASGNGTVFRISQTGSFTNLHSFSYSDGVYPNAGLVQGNDGNFYGTTSSGGASGKGIVFRISPGGNLTNLHSFSGSDGADPNGGLVQGSDGNFYGTTESGGTSTNCSGGCGTVFQISSSGNFKSLWSFGSDDGAYPEAELVQGNDGKFYGTTSLGGTNDAGTVFRISAPTSPPATQIFAIQLNGTNVIISIISAAGQTYQLQFRNSMTAGSWSSVAGASVTNSIGGILTLTNLGGASQPQRFYRLTITP